MTASYKAVIIHLDGVVVKTAPLHRHHQPFALALTEEGIETYDDALEQLLRWQDAGFATALLTSSGHGEAILAAAGLSHLEDLLIDGGASADDRHQGEPPLDALQAAARSLELDPDEAILVAASGAGVERAAAAQFGLVVGIDRQGQGTLLDHGADIALLDLRDLPDLQPPDRDPGSHREMHPWELIYTRWDPQEQALREALCALGNGCVVTRGAMEEADADEVHYPGTYIAGGFNRLESLVSGRVIENEDLVNWPNWLPLTFRVPGEAWFALDQVEILDFDFRLDLRRGLLQRTLNFRDAEGRESCLVTRRLVHLGHHHLAAIQWVLTPQNWSGTVEVRSALDGAVINQNVERYGDLNNQHLTILSTGWEGDDAMFLSARTTQSRLQMTQAARTRAWCGDAPAPTRRHYDQRPQRIAQHLFLPAEEHNELRVEKVVSLRTSLDRAISEPEIAAREDLRAAPPFDDLLQSQTTRWEHLWSLFDIELLNGDAETQLILRLHLFHLLQSIGPNTIDRDIGVPARGWHGEAYRGHIFWDELFIFPLIALHLPELGRSLLMYRYRRLPRARVRARQEGFQGAMYPWQSGSDGREESQVYHLNPQSGRWLPDTTHLQRHVNAAIAFNVWSYFQATGDAQFLASYGAEILLEISRFFSSLATYDARRDRFEIRGVVGPDEFHTDDPHTQEPGLNNNAYTNVMASWVLRATLTCLQRLEQERTEQLLAELAIDDEEIARWDRVSRRLLIPFHGEKIISQFEGYEDLEELNWEHYRRQHGQSLRLDRILEAEGDDVNRYKASKQADVLMLFYLFSSPELQGLFDHMGYEFTEDLMGRTIDYYMERTAHGSTLSQVVHSWVLARRDRKEAWSFWQEALRTDIEDIQGGTTHEGIHLGAMASTVDQIHRGFTGLSMAGDTLWFDPLLPEDLSDLKMRLQYRGHWLTLLITQEELTISLDRGDRPAIKIGFCGQAFEMEQGQTRTFPIQP